LSNPAQSRPGIRAAKKVEARKARARRGEASSAESEATVESEAIDARKPEARRPDASGSMPKLLNIGYGNVVLASRVVAVVSPQSSPMRRLREEASERGKLVDATQGRRTRSILVTDSDHVILSAVNPETIASRLSPGDGSSGS
jgi:regulator of extracellular matrix RemA (YlzA/DUF370 family)